MTLYGLLWSQVKLGYVKGGNTHQTFKLILM